MKGDGILGNAGIHLDRYDAENPGHLLFCVGDGDEGNDGDGGACDVLRNERRDVFQTEDCLVISLASLDLGHDDADDGCAHNVVPNDVRWAYLQ